MDISYALLNKKVKALASGVSDITPLSNGLRFTTLSGSNIDVTLPTHTHSNLNIILEKFTLEPITNQLLFNGNPLVGGSVDLSNYLNKTEINNLLVNKADKTYVDDKNDTKANLVHNHSISDITNLQTNLDNKMNVDGTKVLSQNDFTDAYKQKVDSMTNGSKYIGLFPTLTERNSATNLINGNWCTVDIDSSHSNKKTKYYYDGSAWIFDGIYQDNFFGIDDTSTTSTQNGWSANKLVTELELKANKDGTNINLTAIEGDIIPITNGIQNIGSPTNRFNKIYVNEAMLSTNTLYIGDTPVIGTNQDTIMVKADLDQSLVVKTTGIGTTKVISGSGVELSTSGMNANVNVQATGIGSNANLTATNQVNLNAPNINIQGSTNITGGTTLDNLTVNGNLVMNGSAFTVEATTVRIEDNIIELNKNEVGTGVTAGKAGIKINRGDADAYLMVFDETDDMFKVGTDSSLQAVATQNYVNNNTHIHTNKTVLDKFTDVGGQPYYNGNAIGGNGTLTYFAEEW